MGSTAAHSKSSTGKIGRLIRSNSTASRRPPARPARIQVQHRAAHRFVGRPEQQSRFDSDDILLGWLNALASVKFAGFDHHDRIAGNDDPKFADGDDSGLPP